jgi:hypothetical protein
MARGSLFEYAVLYHPTTKRNGAGEDITEPSTIVQSPKVVLAKTDKEVGMKAAREVPKEYEDKLDNIEIVIRPF